MDQSGDANLEYQENQVLWAKIRGYPWWPAFVKLVKFIPVTTQKTIHTQSFSLEITLSTYILQQEVSSRLGTLKLRKFFEHYSNFYEKSLKNKKLRISIEKAEQRLQQNNQDTTIYEKIRNSIKGKKKRSHAKSESKISSEQRQSIHQIPQLLKNRSQPAKRGRKPGVKLTPKPKIAEMSQQSNNNGSLSNEGEKSSLNKEKNENTINNRTEEVDISGGRLPNRATRLRAREQIKQQKINQKLDEDDQSESQKISQQSPQKPAAKRGRKGRPRKIMQAIVDGQSEILESVSEKQIKNRPSRKSLGRPKGRKPFQKLMQQNVSIISQTPTIKTLQEVERVRGVLDSRQSLIRLLLNMNITTENIKQILDLGITDILLDGTISKTVFLLLNSLKATLLHKYFPEDNKHRRKHEKLTKQKRKHMIQDQENNKDEGADEIEEQNNDSQQQQNMIQNMKPSEEQFAQYNEIRKKTVLKLEKMLKKAELDKEYSSIKDEAIRIQRIFQQRSEQEEIKYNKIALEKMREIKQILNDYKENKNSIKSVKDYLKKLINIQKIPLQNEDEDHQNRQDPKQEAEDEDNEQQGEDEPQENGEDIVSESDSDESEEEDEYEDQQEQDDRDVKAEKIQEEQQEIDEQGDEQEGDEQEGDEQEGDEQEGDEQEDNEYSDEQDEDEMEQKQNAQRLINKTEKENLKAKKQENEEQELMQDDIGRQVDEERKKKHDC